MVLTTTEVTRGAVALSAGATSGIVLGVDVNVWSLFAVALIAAIATLVCAKGLS